MRKKLNIGVVFGGRSGEHEVSLVSAKSVISALDKSKYNVYPIGITRTGQWIAGKGAMQYLKTGKKVGIKKQSILPEPNKSNLDVLFPVLHGPFGEDGTIQGLFQLADIPYVGANVLASACGMDKIIMKALFIQANIPTPKYIGFSRYEYENNKNKIIKSIAKELKYPVFTKPANLGSSVGINKCLNSKQLKASIKGAFAYDRKVIVEQAIVGREIECSVLGHNDPKASLPGEIIPKRDFYDYDAKYVSGDSDLVIPAKLNKQQINNIKSLSIKVFKAIDCSGMARVDFFIQKSTGKIFANEINTIPGFTEISMYTKLWEASGISYAKLLDKLVKLAIERHNEQNKYQKSFLPSTDWYKQ
ncbi:D-alanine--D-alanine ligase [Patescibacteria group bacterium]|nr:D-alanine--D-alanine ligase [Patescibacteria group bacterium]MBU1890152.1 D-alanine--D-alanine ligase [Patescibacteria group bacterium]